LKFEDDKTQQEACDGQGAYNENKISPTPIRFFGAAFLARVSMKWDVLIAGFEVLIA